MKESVLFRRSLEAGGPAAAAQRPGLLAASSSRRPPSSPSTTPPPSASPSTRTGSSRYVTVHNIGQIFSLPLLEAQFFLAWDLTLTMVSQIRNIQGQKQKYFFAVFKYVGWYKLLIFAIN
jgi:hypothetical protein